MLRLWRLRVPKNCAADGHIWGPGEVCVFCKAPKPAAFYLPDGTTLVADKWLLIYDSAKRGMMGENSLHFVTIIEELSLAQELNRANYNLAGPAHKMCRANLTEALAAAIEQTQLKDELLVALKRLVKCWGKPRSGVGKALGAADAAIVKAEVLDAKTR